MTTHYQLSEEVERSTIGVSQRQERQNAAALKEERATRLGVNKTTSEDHISREVVERDHHTLRRTCRTRGVVQQDHLLIGDGVEFNILHLETIGILRLEVIIQRLQRLGYCTTLLLVHNVQALERQCSLQQGHTIRVKALPMSVASKKQTALRVGYDVLDIGGIEILKNGDYDHTIGNRCDVAYAPIDVVTTYQGDLVAVLDAQLVKEHMQASHLLGHLEVGDSLFAEVIGQHRQGVIFAEALLVDFDQILL